jgi:hypothetical protein
VTDLADLVDSLKRAVAPPGEFSTLYANATDDDVVGQLMDGFAEAQLDGWFTAAWGGQKSLDVDSGLVTPDLAQPQQALVVIYSAYRMIYTRLLNLKTHTRYEARGAVYENDQAATLLSTLLKQFADRKELLYKKALYSGANAAFHMADGYFLAASQRYLTPTTAYGFSDEIVPYPHGT